MSENSKEMNKNLNKDNLIERIYIKGTLENTSPILIGSEEDNNSDVDFIRDWEGKPFIPGTSLAGTIRHYLLKCANKKNNIIKEIKELFGEDDKGSFISKIWIYDSFIKDNKEIRLYIRDGVEIDERTKVTKEKSKYDYEILEPGYKFDFRIEVIFRGEDKEKSDIYKGIIYYILDSLKNEAIRVGRKTNRGLGRIKLTDIHVLDLDFSKDKDKENYIEFEWSKLDNIENNEWENWKQNNIFDFNYLTHIKAKYYIPYSLMIRYYNSNPDAPDMVHAHLHSGNKYSIIPASSWSGLLRHTAIKLGRALGKEEKIKNIVNELFGEKDGEKKETISKPSKIIVEDSILKDKPKRFSYTRNRIDRFTGGTIESALFEEQPEYEKHIVPLELKIKNAQKKEIGLILLILREIGEGLAPIGGENSVGRGILYWNNNRKEVYINDNLINIEDNEYLKELAIYLNNSNK